MVWVIWILTKRGVNEYFDKATHRKLKSIAGDKSEDRFYKDLEFRKQEDLEVLSAMVLTE